ncbi:MAG: RluA family pseudouridine synthase [Candidatus Delongbacteria bacterium]|nr:RluA family pseudouridine synthase [Candidatus Delongbacteria bacterium]
MDIEELKNIETLEIKVAPNQSKQRIDKFLFSNIKRISRNKIQNLIDSGNILVNGKEIKSNYSVLPNDDIVVNIPRPEKYEILPEDIKIDFVYEDEYLAVINKQMGLVVHPTYSVTGGTLVNALMFHFKDQLSSVNGKERPGIVHRLDKDTTGLMVVAKNDLVHQPLAEQFASKTAGREYIGICIGKFSEKSGRIETLLTRWQRDRKVMIVSEFEGKRAATNYEVIEEFNRFTLVKFVLETGRTHQIRAHMKHINRPLFGDPFYGGTNLKMIDLPRNQMKRLSHMLDILPRQALHARKLEFFHPVLKKHMSFEAEIPEDINKVLELIRKYEY